MPRLETDKEERSNLIHQVYAICSILGLNRADLARKLGLRPVTFYRWISGEVELDRALALKIRDAAKHAQNGCEFRTKVALRGSADLEALREHLNHCDKCG
ncbi:MAG: hypothetical protein ACRD1R_01650 [Acidobacteriota bacterium]